MSSIARLFSCLFPLLVVSAFFAVHELSIALPGGGGTVYAQSDNNGDGDFIDPGDDFDGDALINSNDADDDNDGVIDPNDAFPFDASEDTDTDGDGIGNNADADDDGDGVVDGNDAFPLDPQFSGDTDGDGTDDQQDNDDDNDFNPDATDPAPLDPDVGGFADTDGDGVPDNVDTDDDGDGIPDSEEGSDVIFGDGEFTDSVEAGIRIDANRMLKVREVSSAKKLREMRRRSLRHARFANEAGMVYVSLPRAFAAAREQLKADGEIDKQLKHLAGLTRLDYVFVYPGSGELVVAGPAEPVDATEPHRPVGRKTGRPVVQLTDLVDMLRVASADVGKVGCSLDPDPDSMKRVQAVARKYGSISAGERARFARDMKEAMGGQKVRLFGVAEASRGAQAFLVADYRMKRQALGLDPIPVRGMTHAIARRAKAAGRFWFESSYEPIKMSADKRVYALSGKRLQVKSGRLMFQEGGASRKARGFATNFTRHMDKLAAAEPAYADLQNLTDLFLLAHLIRADKLDNRTGWDWGWASSADNWPTPRFNVPETAEPLISFTNRSIAAGGVSIKIADTIAQASRAVDNTGELAKLLPELPEKGWFWYENAGE